MGVDYQVLWWLLWLKAVGVLVRSNSESEVASVSISNELNPPIDWGSFSVSILSETRVFVLTEAPLVLFGCCDGAIDLLASAMCFLSNTSLVIGSGVSSNVNDLSFVSVLMVNGVADGR